MPNTAKRVTSKLKAAVHRRPKKKGVTSSIEAKQDYETKKSSSSDHEIYKIALLGPTEKLADIIDQQLVNDCYFGDMNLSLAMSALNAGDIKYFYNTKPTREANFKLIWMKMIEELNPKTILYADEAEDNIAFYAAKNGYLGALELILSTPDLESMIDDKTGKSLLTQLLEHRNYRGQSILHAALENDQSKILERLLKLDSQQFLILVQSCVKLQPYIDEARISEELKTTIKEMEIESKKAFRDSQTAIAKEQLTPLSEIKLRH
jgi:hypothetical protein